MKINRETISKTKVKLTITLDASELKDAEQVALVRIAKTLKVPGFRKGRIPVAVAAKHANPAVLAEETANTALSKAVAEAFTSEDLRALDRPEVEVTKFVPSQELEFTAETEIMPDIKLGNYKKLKVGKQDSTKVEQAEIDEVLDRIRQQMATKKEVERKAKNGDEVIIDFVGKKDGVAFDGGTGNAYPLALGSHSFIPGFEEAIVGHKPGESFDIPLSFPEDYQAKDLAGQAVVFSVELKKVNEQVLPEIDDELAAKVGPFTSADELLADITKELTAQKEQTNRQKLQDELVEQLIAKSTVPVPEILKKDRLESIERDVTQNLLYQGMTQETWLEKQGFKSKDEWLEKDAGPMAEKQVQASLVLAELAKAENITATEEELAAKLQEFKEQYGRQPEMVKRFDEPEVQRSVANQILTEKTLDLLVKENVK
jgi:trigger factor